MYKTLITVSELVHELSTPDWAIIDCRFSSNTSERGPSEYFKAHIPGAVYAHLNEDLSGEIIPGKTGRHPLPSIEKCVRVLSTWGIDSGVQVVVYDDSGGSMAARLWWMLRWLGHEAVAVLDGGWQQWQREGFATTSGLERRDLRTFIPHVRTDLLFHTSQIVGLLHDPQFRLFDSRSADRYRGENETIDPVAGHIPNAVSAPFADNLDENGLFLSQQALQTRFHNLLKDIPAERAIFYCGSGVTATHNLLALAHAGLGEGRLYAGSWSEWIVDPHRPICEGESDKSISHATSETP